VNAINDRSDRSIDRSIDRATSEDVVTKAWWLLVHVHRVRIIIISLNIIIYSTWGLLRILRLVCTDYSSKAHKVLYARSKRKKEK
jgi:hypothetical protein